LLLAFLIIFISLRFNYGRGFLPSLCAALAAVTGWCVMGTRTPNRSSPLMAVILIALSGIFAFHISSEIDGDVPPGSAFISSEGEVVDISDGKFGRTALVKSGGAKYVLYIPLPREPREGTQKIIDGDIVKFSGYVEPFERAKESKTAGQRPGAFDPYLYWKGRGAIAKVSYADAEVTGHSGGIARWRGLLGERIKGTLPARTSGYMLASLVGETDAALGALHREVGTSHILAVSGAHVMIVFGVLWFFLRSFSFRLYAISACLWIYTALAGAAPSAVRAAFMLQLLIIGRLAGRSGNAFNTVSAAGVIMLLRNPWIFWNVGWRLSVMSVLVLSALPALYIPPWQKAASASPLVWLVTSAQSARTFGAVPLAGLIANFFALPVFAALLPMSFALSLPALLGLPFAKAAYIAEACFILWERLSMCILAFCPQGVRFSPALAIAAFAAASYLCARGSGFSPPRAYIAAAINIAALSAGLIFQL
jgi:competence protein ComEC